MSNVIYQIVTKIRREEHFCLEYLLRTNNQKYKETVDFDVRIKDKHEANTVSRKCMFY